MTEINLTSETFETEVFKAEKTVLVDFWAPWCGPCRMLAPIIEELAEEKGDALKVCKVNVDEEPELAAAFGIASIPTVIIFKAGKAVNKTIGLCAKEELEALL